MSNILSYSTVWSSLNDSALANIRQYARRANGDLQATKQGISLGVKSFDSLRASIMDLTLMNVAKEILSRRINEPTLPFIDLTDLQQALPFIVYKTWLQRVQENCKRCRDLRLIFKEPLRKDPGHSCHWKTGLTEMVLSATMKNEIIKELQTGRKILGENQAFLLYLLNSSLSCLLFTNKKVGSHFRLSAFVQALWRTDQFR